jgi:hypothetical protein
MTPSHLAEFFPETGFLDISKGKWISKFGHLLVRSAFEDVICLIRLLLMVLDIK